MKLALLCAAALIGFTTSASAKIAFSAYEGPNATTVGKGGTKVTEQGIDWWVTGEPPHTYQIIGVLTDARREGKLRGHAIGSKSVAEKVREVGGNAVIVLRESDTNLGSSTFVQRGQGFGSGIATAITDDDIRHTVSFAVIKVVN